MARVIELFFTVLKAALALLLGVMVVMVFGNVVLRYFFNSGITISEELSRLAFVWLVFIGAAVALRERQHLGMDFLVRLLPRNGRIACLFATYLLMLYATWLLLWGSWRQTLLNIDVPLPVTGLSTGWFYGIGVFFGLLAGIILLVDVFRLATGRLTDDELIGIKENEEETDVGKIEEDLRHTGGLGGVLGGAPASAPQSTGRT